MNVAAGIVLAGGRSSRMGTAKAALEWHGSTLLRHVAGVVGRAVEGPVIVVRALGQEKPELDPPGSSSATIWKKAEGRCGGSPSGLRAERGALMPILHRVVEEVGFVTFADTKVIADVLNLSEADVHGVATFYPDFRREPAARSVIQICRGEACQAVGADRLVEHATSSLGVGMGAKADDGSVELQQIFCFGNCALGPTINVDGCLHGRVTPDRFDGIVEETHRVEETHK